jgi:hypothetical protein
MIERPSRTAAFGSPVALGGLDAANKGYPTLSADELTLYFEQSAAPGLQIFEVHRTAIGAPFGPPSRPPGFPAGADDDDPTITSDGRAMVFSSVRKGSHDLYLSIRACQ